jgi:hypothetical protein
MTHEKKARAGTQSAQARKQARKLQRIPMAELEPVFAAAIPAIDKLIMQRVRGMLSGFSEEPFSACIERQLLPRRVASAVETAEFISKWIVLARTAQIVTGVPASILLAEIWFSPNDPNYDPISGRPIPGNDLFKRGKSFASLGAALLDHASYLASERRFQPVMLARHHSTGVAPRYIEAIAACELWDADGRKDRADTVREHALPELDVLPLES